MDYVKKKKKMDRVENQIMDGAILATGLHFEIVLFEWR